jgi:hypothetical protein
MEFKKTSKTLPYTLLACSLVVLLINVSSMIPESKLSIGPGAVVLLIVTFIVVKRHWFDKEESS